MSNTNKDIEKGIANGTLCRDILIKLKEYMELNGKNWDRRKLLSISMKNMVYILCKHWKYRNSVTSGEKIKIYPETCGK